MSVYCIVRSNHSSAWLVIRIFHPHFKQQLYLVTKSIIDRLECKTAYILSLSWVHTVYRNLCIEITLQQRKHERNDADRKPNDYCFGGEHSSLQIAYRFERRITMISCRSYVLRKQTQADLLTDQSDQLLAYILLEDVVDSIFR